MSESTSQELRLVKIHDDGEHLVLESTDGSQFTLPIDQNLRTSVAKARRLQPARSRAGGGSFGPRDIQTRFRQGASVEEIVAESGWEAERVRRYEWPIVAERAHIIGAARAVVISSAGRSRGDETEAATLDQHLAQQAEKYGFSTESADWNTFQQESGSWTITLDLEIPASVLAELPRGVVFPARWSYNPANQSIYASNESAYFLMGRNDSTDAPIPGIGRHDAQLPQSSEQGKDSSALAEKSPAHQSPRSQSAPSSSAMTQNGARDYGSARERKLADLLDRARRLSQNPTEEAAQESTSAPADTTSFPPQDSAEKSAEKPAQALPTSATDTPAEKTREQHDGQASENLDLSAQEKISAPTNSDQESAPSASASPADQQESTQQSPAEEVTPQPSVADQQEQAAGEEAEPEATSPKPSRPKRTSVPSWDDIIFGSQRK